MLRRSRGSNTDRQTDRQTRASPGVSSQDKPEAQHPLLPSYGDPAEGRAAQQSPGDEPKLPGKILIRPSNNSRRGESRPKGTNTTQGAAGLTPGVQRSNTSR